jgi:hypothetical protein
MEVVIGTPQDEIILDVEYDHDGAGYFYTIGGEITHYPADIDIVEKAEEAGYDDPAWYCCETWEDTVQEQIREGHREKMEAAYDQYISRRVDEKRMGRI